MRPRHRGGTGCGAVAELAGSTGRGLSVIVHVVPGPGCMRAVEADHQDQEDFAPGSKHQRHQAGALAPATIV